VTPAAAVLPEIQPVRDEPPATPMAFMGGPPSSSGGLRVAVAGRVGSFTPMPTLGGAERAGAHGEAVRRGVLVDRDRQ
jgi:hypothetical protein